MILSGKAWGFIACIAAAFLLTTFRNGGKLSDPPNLQSIPLRIASWEGAEESLSGGVLQILGVERYIYRAYKKGDSRIAWIYIGYYKSQSQGQTTHSPQHCYPGSGWSPLESAEEDIAIPQIGRTIRVHRYVVSKDKTREIVYYWYQERERIIANEYKAKAYLVWDSIVRGRSDGALVRFSIRSNGDYKQDTELLRGFISGMFPSINAVFR